MLIGNRIAECWDGYAREVDLDLRDAIVIHRCGVGETAKEVAEAFVFGAAGKSTGHQVPYTFVIDKGGLVTQLLRLGDFGPHARAWSSRGVGIACTGDFRRHLMPPPQYASLEDLVLLLASRLGPDSIYGHDELPEGSRSPDKRCPGIFLDLDKLRADVKARLSDGLRAAGITL